VLSLFIGWLISTLWHLNVSSPDPSSPSLFYIAATPVDALIARLAMSKFGSKKRFEPELNRTEPKVHVQVRHFDNFEPNRRFTVQRLGDLRRTRPNASEHVRTVEPSMSGPVISDHFFCRI
jgi:hypothetical protein